MSSRWSLFAMRVVAGMSLLACRRETAKSLSPDFEGVITMSGHGVAGPTSLVTELRRGAHRVEAKGGLGSTRAQSGATILFPPTLERAWLLEPAEKKAIVYDFADLAAVRAALKAPARSAPVVEKTGRMEVVAGYPCEDWSVTVGKERGRLCVAKGIGWADLTELGWTASELELARACGRTDGFPLRVVSLSEDGQEKGRLEATKIEARSLDHERFALPPGYEELGMDELLGAVPAFSSGPIPSGTTRVMPPPDAGGPAVTDGGRP